ncbi:MAG: Shedu immune nuclease family protein [Terriglobales bacterium]
MNAGSPRAVSSAVTNTDFVIGEESFDELEFKPALQRSLRHIFNKVKKQPVKQFVLARKLRVAHLCRVTLIEKGDRFTPRLAFSIRDETGQIRSKRAAAGDDTYDLKASVDLEDCHENFWKLVSFLGSLKEVDIPKESFSLVSHDESEIVSALRERDTESLVSIIRQLASAPGVSLSHEDVNQLLRRKEKLSEFEDGLEKHRDEEAWWQKFFEQNKWIFGYGLNYQILRQEQSQPYYGGAGVDGRGGRKGDYLHSTQGDINFTVLVEIKTPNTRLLQGGKPMRSGAWSLSKALTDSISQVEADIDKWASSGSRETDNQDSLERRGVFTVQPKGIVVLGSLTEVKDIRDKRETFQRFRQSIHGIDVITFDELRERAKFIVRNRD